MSEEVETLGEAPPPLNDLPRTIKSFMQFSYSVTPPLPELLDLPQARVVHQGKKFVVC